MQVTAFKTRESPAWRWRIVSYAGETIEESSRQFVTIGAAVSEGTRRLRAMPIVDHSRPVTWRRSTSSLRPR
jgi:hypothetical protein